MSAEAQQALLAALLQGDSPRCLIPVGPGVSLERGLAAYRSNLRALSARSLGAVFPRLAGQLGEADFATLAWSFWRQHPPERGDLACWGDRLSDFLGEHAGEASGLPGLAQLEWALHGAERAEELELDADSLALLATEPPETIALRLRSGVAVLRLHPAALQRLDHQGGSPLLVWREAWQARWQLLEPASAAFFDGLVEGQSLQSALDAATTKGIGVSRDFDFSAWLQDALRHPWLHKVVRLETPDRTTE